MVAVTTTAVSMYMQSATTPVVLISAGSLLLLSLTNRYSILTTSFRSSQDFNQQQILYNRIIIMKCAICFNIASISTLFVLIIISFSFSVFHKHREGLYLICGFSASLGLQFISLVCLMLDTLKSSSAIMLVEGF